MRQTFLEPVEWQVSEIRKAFFESLPGICSVSQDGEPVRPDPRGFARIGGKAAILLPRPSVLGEIVRGPRLRLSSTEREALANRDGEAKEAVGDKGRSRAMNHDKDFDFREAFAVYEDRDLAGCPPLREVSKRASVGAPDTQRTKEHLASNISLNQRGFLSLRTDLDG